MITHAGKRQLPELALAVRLGQELLAIPLQSVQEVLPALPLETAPGCPDFVRGVVYVRGQLIPVLDAARRLGLTGHAPTLDPHIVCLSVEGRLIGVEFDEALDLLDLRGAEILPASRMGSEAGFFQGVVDLGGQFVRILDPARLVNLEESAALSGFSPMASPVARHSLAES